MRMLTKVCRCLSDGHNQALQSFPVMSHFAVILSLGRFSDSYLMDDEKELNHLH